MENDVNMFNFGEDQGSTDSETKKESKGAFNLAHLIGKETLNWISGDVAGKPQELKQLGDDFAQKLNWYIGCTILAQYARIPQLFEVLETISKKLFDNVATFEDPKDLISTYTGLTKEITQVMEFARKFVVQNKEFLVDNTNFFDRSLFEKIKALPTDAVRDYLSLFQIVEQKGQQILKEIIDKYK